MNAVIYARYSSHNQTEQSIEGQLRDCYAFAEREGLTVIGEYIDRAISGRSDDRPDFQRMIADAAKKQFQFVIVWKLDRFARNRYDSAIYKAKLKKYGVRVLSATENIGDNPESIILEGMLESLAEFYSANLAKHVKRGMKESALKGTSLGGTPPVGYKYIDKRPIIDDDTAPIIQYAFEQYAVGVPKKKIVEDLNAKGVRNGRGQILSYTSFSHALKNRKYIGENSYTDAAGNVIEINNFPPLIDKEIFNKVQARLAMTARAPAQSKAKVEYLLSGKLFCGCCGTRMVGESGKGRGGVIYNYYTCSKRKKEKTCKKLNEKKDFLEWYIVEQTVEYVLTPERMELIAEKVVEEYDKEFNDGKIMELERRIAKLDKDINHAVDAVISAANKAISERFMQKASDYESQKADMEIDLSKLKVANGIRYKKEDVMAWLKLFCKGDLFDMEFRRRIIDVFINSIYLYDDKVVIFYNIKGGKQISYIEMLDSTEGYEELTPLDSAEQGKAVRISRHMPCQNILSLRKCAGFVCWGFCLLRTERA